MLQTHRVPIVAVGAVSAGLAIALSFGTPTVSFAATSDELQAQLDSASAQLDALYGEAEQAHYDLDAVTNDLNSTNDQIAQVQADIEDQTKKLREVQDQLSAIVTAQYKVGSSNLISIVLGSSDFDDLVTRVTYANKVSEQQQNVIGEARSLKTSLEQKQSELQQQQARQQQLVTEQQQKKESADAAVESAQEYYDGLSAELKAKMEEEKAAAAAEAQRQAEQVAAAAQKRGEADSGASASNSGSTVESGGASQESSEAGAASGGSSGSAAPTTSVSAMVNRAYLAYGASYRYSGYVWTGSASSSAFTCSGLVDFALGRPTNSSWPESLITQVSNYTTDPSQLRYGDLVFFRYDGRSPGHVGIYVGDGTMLDSSPGGGVQERSIYKSSFMGGGSIL